MSSLDYVANEAEIPRGTLVDLFFEATDRFGSRPAFRYFPGDGPFLLDIPYEALPGATMAVAGGLREMGLERGDHAAILSENRPQWAMADYGCLCAGVVDVPIYSTLVASQVAHILEDSGARLVFASTEEQMEKVHEACREIGRDVLVVTFEKVKGLATADVVSWEDFLGLGRERMRTVSREEFRASARKARPEDVATILYTSGTTGSPKGVVLTHNNLHSNVVASGQVLPMTEEDSTLSFLPLSHVLQRMVDYLFFSRGCTIAYAHDIRTVAQDLKVVEPTLVVSVPRLYEKVYERVMDVPGFKGRLVQWAREVGTAWTEEKLAGREPSGVLRLVHRLADRLVYEKIREEVGGRLRYFVSGGAPLEPAINKFFYGVGLTILEGYGLTETSPVTNVNTLERYKIGTVGPPIPGTEIRVEEDGEILVRGPQVMKGYYNRPEATAEAIDPDGWFRTGDIGEIDRDGFLRITDRKKDLIVTAGGKNVAPQPIENRLKTSAFVDQVVMVGDRRKFVALLVVPSFETLEAWAEGKKIDSSGRRELLRNDKVQKKLEAEILGRVGDLASFETPKKMALLERPFTLEDGTLTPTQKVRRRVVQDRFDPVIDEFYRDGNEDRTVFLASDVGGAPGPGR